MSVIAQILFWEMNETLGGKYDLPVKEERIITMEEREGDRKDTDTKRPPRGET